MEYVRCIESTEELHESLLTLVGDPSYGTEVYKHTTVVWDEDHDERIFWFIDGLKAKEQPNLFAAGEHEGALSLIWKAAKAPMRYHVKMQLPCMIREGTVRIYPATGVLEGDAIAGCIDEWTIITSLRYCKHGVCEDGKYRPLISGMYKGQLIPWQVKDGLSLDDWKVARDGNGPAC